MWVFTRTERPAFSLACAEAGVLRGRREGGSVTRLLGVLAFLLLRAGLAGALVIGGGGGTATECLLTLDAPVNYRPERPRHVLCSDGGPCDEDGTVNGVCEFSVAVCSNHMTFDDRCTYSGVQSVAVQHAFDDGDPKFDPDFQALQSRIDSQIAPPTTFTVCTAPTAIRVPIRGPLGTVCGRGTKKLRITTVSMPPPAGAPRSDKDKLKLMCEPAPVDGCDPQTLFPGTFDRIQKQILNQSCAVSGCHDSQTLAGGMTLEQGTAYAALVGVAPSNTAADGAGWLRVAPGDPATSFVFHKLTGDLPDASFGARMPWGKPKLDQLLIDVIELWIAAGAPETGWVAGTD